MISMCYISNYNWQLYSNAPYTLGLVFLETLYSVILKRRRKYLALLTHLIFHGFPLSLILWCNNIRLDISQLYPITFHQVRACLWLVDGYSIHTRLVFGRFPRIV